MTEYWDRLTLGGVEIPRSAPNLVDSLRAIATRIQDAPRPPRRVVVCGWMPLIDEYGEDVHSVRQDDNVLVSTWMFSYLLSLPVTSYETQLLPAAFGRRATIHGLEVVHERDLQP